MPSKHQVGGSSPFGIAIFLLLLSGQPLHAASKPTNATGPKNRIAFAEGLGRGLLYTLETTTYSAPFFSWGVHMTMLGGNKKNEKDPNSKDREPVPLFGFGLHTNFHVIPNGYFFQPYFTFGLTWMAFDDFKINTLAASPGLGLDLSAFGYHLRATVYYIAIEAWKPTKGFLWPGVAVGWPL